MSHGKTHWAGRGRQHTVWWHQIWLTLHRQCPMLAVLFPISSLPVPSAQSEVIRNWHYKLCSYLLSSNADPKFPLPISTNKSQNNFQTHLQCCFPEEIFLYFPRTKKHVDLEDLQTLKNTGLVSLVYLLIHNNYLYTYLTCFISYLLSTCYLPITLQ